MEVIDLIDDSDEEIKQDHDEILISNLYSIQIKLSDYKRLSEGVYLNDNLIDFFLNIQIEKKKVFYLFNSFFFPTLNDQGFSKVKNWFKNIDQLFAKKYWIVPISVAEHWILVIIRHPRNAFTNELPYPSMLLFDSLDCQKFNPGPKLEKFIEKMWALRGYPSKKVAIPIHMLKLPRQNNFYDCGIFLLQYSDLFIDDPAKFRKANEENLNFSDLFSVEDMNTKRSEMKNVILQLTNQVKISSIRPGIPYLFNASKTSNSSKKVLSKSQNSEVNNFTPKKKNR